MALEISRTHPAGTQTSLQTTQDLYVNDPAPGGGHPRLVSKRPRSSMWTTPDRSANCRGLVCELSRTSPVRWSVHQSRLVQDPSQTRSSYRPISDHHPRLVLHAKNEMASQTSLRPPQTGLGSGIFGLKKTLNGPGQKLRPCRWSEKIFRLLMSDRSEVV